MRVFLKSNWEEIQFAKAVKVEIKIKEKEIVFGEYLSLGKGLHL